MSHAAAPLHPLPDRASQTIGRLALFALRLAIVACVGAVGFTAARTLVYLVGL